VHYYTDETSKWPGLLRGVELLDFAGKSILKAGENSISDYSKYTDIDLVAGERIIGMKCGRGG
jgi:hypothetical protein